MNYILIVFAFLLSACTVFQKSEQNPVLGESNLKLLYNTWYHSFEEDYDGYTVFRPEKYDFPLARGRTGYTFKENSTLIIHDISANDLPIDKYGNWRLVGADIIISLENSVNKQFKIIKINENQLVINID